MSSNINGNDHTPDHVHSLIRLRRSARAIDSSRLIEPEKIYTLLEAARWAPSCLNKQSWRYIVIQDQSLAKIKTFLSEGNAWAKQAPLIIAVTSKADLGCQINGRDYFTLDIGLSIENMLLQGIHLGLVMHPIAGFDEGNVKSVLNIPAQYRVFALIIIGYPGSLYDLDESVKAKESAHRSRKHLNEIVYWEQWDHS